MEQIKANDNWETPKNFYDELNKLYQFDFDPCPLNYEEITDVNNGLLIEWGQRNFVNPPYSKKLKEQFIHKAIKESKKGKLCVMLLPVRTSSKIFHDTILPNAKEIKFIKGRLKFIGKDKNGNITKNNARFDNMLVIFDLKNKY